MKYHLKQSGLDFEIADLISIFIGNTMEKSEQTEVSKNEEKILKSHLDQNQLMITNLVFE